MTVLGSLAAALLALFGGARYLVDPLQIRDPFDAPWTRHKFHYSLGTTRALLRKLDGNERFALVFGTSRVQRVSPRVLGVPTLNFSALYGDPRSILPVLRGLKPKQIANIRKIYFLLDGFAFKDAFVETVDFESPAAAWRYELGQLGNNEMKAAYRTIWMNLTGRYDYYFDEHGYYVGLNEGQFNPDIPLGGFDDMSFSVDAVAALGEIDRFCKAHDLEIVYFTLPVTDKFLQGLDFGPIAAIRREYLRHIDHFQDLLYLEGVSDDYRQFSDQSHLKTTGQMKVFGAYVLPQAGHIVRPDNVEAQIRYLRERHEARRP